MNFMTSNTSKLRIAQLKTKTKLIAVNFAKLYATATVKSTTFGVIQIANFAVILSEKY